MYCCLVRWVIKKRLQNRDGAHYWLRGEYDHLGKWKKGWNDLHPDSSLEKDVREQWAKGNRGNEGEWK